ncbi:MAG: (Fe-S)-binding protein [Phycisphaerae bacterium]|jgi:Fe-S oxidoreductase
MNWIVMTLLIVGALALFGWSAWQRWRLMMVARAPASRIDHLGERIQAVLFYMFGQKRMVRYAAAGWAHILVFFGFLVLLLNSIMLWARGYVSTFDFWGVLAVDRPLGAIYALLRDIFTVAVIVGVVIFFYNRVVLRLRRLTLNTEGLLILGIIFTMMVADLVYEGIEIIHGTPEGGSLFRAVMPFGSLTALILSPLPGGAQHVLWHAGFWAHSSLVLIFLNLLPYGKHFHVITVLPNVFCRDLTPSGRVPPLADIEGRLEREETLGVKQVPDLSWKAALDFYTCTECGRCTDQCPANRTGKKLSPKHLSIDLRDHMYRRAGAWLAAAPPAPPAEGEEAPAAGEPDEQDILVPAVIDPEVLWACTTCGACEHECPVFISYIDKIVGMRQHLVMERGEFPEQLQNMFQGLERVGNPYSYPNEQRAEWAAGLDVPLRSDKPDAEWLFWVGCAPSFDDRARKIARATAELFIEAGVDFAILGPEEMCNGDPARRAGNEYLFQMMAQQNVETMNGYNVRKIVACCPHCYHTLKNEYPDFGGKYEVVHHSELLAQLVREGRLRPQHPVSARVAYHDACYLGRHNDVYDPPRDLLAAIRGVQIVEPTDCRDRGMCCGAGGAQMWKEEEEGERRVNHARTNQLLEVLPAGDGRTIASACPFCMTMLTDGLADQGHEGVQTLDIAELLHQAVKGPRKAPAPTTEGA